MGILDDAIREHLELKRRLGADESEVTRLEREAFGAKEAEAEVAPPAPTPAAVEPEPVPVEQPTRQFTLEELEDAEQAAAESEPAPAADDDGEHDELEETPDFLQETPEHDRLWFEQKPPKDFDF